MDIGELEAEILSIVNHLGRATARDVLHLLMGKRDLAYTTTSTTLDRLYKKGLLRRKTQTGRGGTRFVYLPVERKKIRERVVGAVIGRLVRAFGSDIVATVYRRSLELSERELNELERRVRRRRG